MQSADGAALSGGRGLGELPHPAAGEEARRAGGLAGGAVSPTSRQRRRRAPGLGARERAGGEPAHGRAGGEGAAPGAAGGGAGDAALRDAARASAAGRFRRDAGFDRRREGAALSVRGDAWLFPADLRARLPASDCRRRLSFEPNSADPSRSRGRLLILLALQAFWPARGRRGRQAQAPPGRQQARAAARRGRFAPARPRCRTASTARPRAHREART